MLHGESNTSQASRRMTIHRICQPQEECALTRPVTRRVTTQCLHTQNATTCRRCGRNDNQDSPRELSAHRANGIAAVCIDFNADG